MNPSWHVESSDLTPRQLQDSLTLDDVERFLDALGAKPQRGIDTITCLTICHNPVHRATKEKLYYYENTHLFKCYTQCGDAFNIYDLHIKYVKVNEDYDESFWDAFHFVRGFLSNPTAVVQNNGYDIPKPNDYRSMGLVPHCPPISADMQTLFSPQYHQTWVDEGISRAAMEKFGIGYEIQQEKIVIPHRDYKGSLIGIRGRALKQEELAAGRKYTPIVLGDHDYRHSLSYNIYGCYEHGNAIRRFRKATLYEGEKSVLLDDTYYGNYSVGLATCGLNLGRFQVNILLAKLGVSEVTIAFDKEYDRIGDEKFLKWMGTIQKKVEKYKWGIDFYCIVDREGLLGYKNSPIDRGKEVYEALYRDRIRL